MCASGLSGTELFSLESINRFYAKAKALSNNGKESGLFPACPDPPGGFGS